MTQESLIKTVIRDDRGPFGVRTGAQTTVDGKDPA